MKFDPRFMAKKLDSRSTCHDAVMDASGAIQHISEIKLRMQVGNEYVRSAGPILTAAIAQLVMRPRSNEELHNFAIAVGVVFACFARQINALDQSDSVSAALDKMMPTELLDAMKRDLASLPGWIGKGEDDLGEFIPDFASCPTFGRLLVVNFYQDEETDEQGRFKQRDGFPCDFEVIDANEVVGVADYISEYDESDCPNWDDNIEPKID